MIRAITIYIVSIVLNWLWVHIAYSEKGCRSSSCNETYINSELGIILIPIWNTLLVLRCIAIWPYSTSYTYKMSRTFFRIKHQ